MIRNEQQITREFCKGKRLVFFPKTEEEAALIQRQLFTLGFGWADKGAQIKDCYECVMQGFVAMDGQLTTKPTPETFNTGFICTKEQLGCKPDQPGAPHLPLTVQNFNELAARLQAIEAELKPKVLDKPPFTKPGSVTGN